MDNCANWIYKYHEGITNWICSNCKNEAYYDTDYGQQLFDFCPYCGYNMKNVKTAMNELENGKC